MKDKEAQRLALENTQIEALIEKHRPRTPKTPDKVNTLGTGKIPIQMVKRGPKR